MLTRILFLVFAMLITFTTFSQDETGYKRPEFPGDWSVSYNIGPIIDYENNTGHRLSMEIGYVEDESKEFILNLSASSLNLKYTSRYSLIECSIGPRLYPLKTKIFFLEANIGAQINTRIRETPSWDYGYDISYASKKTQSCFYYAAGFGVKIPVKDNNSILMRLKYNSTMPPKDGLTYISAQIGIGFNTFEKKKVNPNSSARRFSLSAGGAVNFPLDQDGYKTSGNGIFFAEGSYRTAPKTEIYTEAAYNRIQRLRNKFESRFVSLCVGPRLFINRSFLS